MAGRFSGISALLASAGLASAMPSGATDAPITPSGAGGADPADPADPADVTAAIQAAHAAGVAEGEAAGVAAERARTAAVLSSDAAQANIGGAAFLLAETDTGAEKIVASLPKITASAAAPSPAPAASSNTPLTVDLSNTPTVDVGTDTPSGEATDGAKVWDEVQKSQSATFTSNVTATGGAVPYAAGG